MIFSCYNCKLPYDAKNFNPARIAVTCPSCSMPNKIDQSIKRVYGEMAGRLAAEVMGPFERVMNKAKGDMSVIVARTYARLEEISKEIL